MPRWKSALLQIDRFLVGAPPGGLCCALEQVTFSLLLSTVFHMQFLLISLLEQ